MQAKSIGELEVSCISVDNHEGEGCLTLPPLRCPPCGCHEWRLSEAGLEVYQGLHIELVLGGSVGYCHVMDVQVGNGQRMVILLGQLVSDDLMAFGAQCLSESSIVARQLVKRVKLAVCGLVRHYHSVVLPVDLCLQYACLCLKPHECSNDLLSCMEYLGGVEGALQLA